MLNLNPVFHHYFIRINEHPGYAAIITELSKLEKFPLFLTMKHEGSKKENPHFHLILSTLQKTATLRTFLKTRFTLGKGNAHMSQKDWDGNERAIQYLFHEEDGELITTKGFTEAFLHEMQEKAATFSREKKSYTNSLYDHVLFQIEQNDDNYGDIVHEHKWDHMRIAYKIWDVCKAQDKSYPNKFLLDSLVRKVQAHLSQKNLKNLPTWEDTKLSWYSDMFPHN